MYTDIMYLHTYKHTRYSQEASFLFDLIKLSLMGEKPDKEGRECYNDEQNGPQVTSLEDRAIVYQGVKLH